VAAASPAASIDVATVDVAEAPDRPHKVPKFPPLAFCCRGQSDHRCARGLIDKVVDADIKARPRCTRDTNGPKSRPHPPRSFLFRIVKVRLVASIETTAPRPGETIKTFGIKNLVFFFFWGRDFPTKLNHVGQLPHHQNRG